jgi:hypothetical protein
MFSVCVQVEALRKADHPCKEPYRLSLIKKLRKLSPMPQKREQAPKCGSNEEEKKLRINSLELSLRPRCHVFIIMYKSRITSEEFYLLRYNAMQSVVNYFYLISVIHASFFLGVFFDPEMKATCSNETFVDFQRITRRHIPEYRILHNHCCENLKSYIGLLLT